MRSKLKTIFMICAVLLGIGMIGPVHSVQAETTKATNQIRVNAEKKTVTVDFADFSSEGYTYTVTNDTSGVQVLTGEAAIASDGQNHLSIKSASLAEGYYSITVTDKASSQSLTKSFYTYEGASKAAYNNTTRTLSWTDNWENSTKQYRIRFYKTSADISSPTDYVAQRMSTSTTREIPSGLNGATYYATITPFVKNSTTTYFGPSAQISFSPITAPTGVEGTAGYKNATISWSSVKGAAYYVVKNLTTNEKVTVKGATKTTIGNLTQKKTYKFCVYSKLGKSTSPRSATVSVYIPATTTGTVSNLEIYAYNSKVYLTWDKVSDADGYKIYYKKASESSYTVLGSTTSTSYTLKLTSNVNYTFKVKPYTLVNNKKIDASAGSATVSGNPYKLLSEMSTVRTIGYYSKTTTKTKLYNSYTSKTVAKTVSSGKKIEQLEAENKKYNRCKVLYNNRVYYCTRSSIKSYASHYTTKDYSTTVKEKFVQNYSSSTKYLIWISQYTQQVNIFKGSKGNWTMIKTFDCATGKHTTRSARSFNFKITYKEDGWYYSTTYEKYITHFYGRNSFHTRIHTYGGGYADATISKPASNGCIRLRDEDAKYIHNKMPKSTKVISY